MLCFHVPSVLSVYAAKADYFGSPTPATEVARQKAAAELSAPDGTPGFLDDGSSECAGSLPVRDVSAAVKLSVLHLSHTQDVHRR